MTIKMQKLRCGECGHVGLAMKDLAHWYKTPYRDFPNVTITESVEMPVCPECNNVIIPGDRSKFLDKAAETSLDNFVSITLNSVLSLKGMTGRKLAKLVGVTPEYISMILNHKKRASFQLTQLLLLIKLHPKLRNDLAVFWGIEM